MAICYIGIQAKHLMESCFTITLANFHIYDKTSFYIPPLRKNTTAKIPDSPLIIGLFGILSFFNCQR